MINRLLLESPHKDALTQKTDVSCITGTTGVYLSRESENHIILPYYHLSRLVKKPLDSAEILIQEQDFSYYSPLLLGLGIEQQRQRLISNRGVESINATKTINTLKNSNRLQALKDIHKGQRAFVIGNGPSLQISDLDKLKNEITFASNKIYLAYENTAWRPSYYTVCDYLVAANNAEIINQMLCTKILPHTLQKYNCHGDGVIWYEERFENKHFDQASKVDQASNEFLFSTNLTHGLQGGYGVIYHQLQLALYMGIKEVYLIGVDFHFNIPDSKVQDVRFASNTYRQALSSSGERNHFHPDYHKPGENWSMPRMDLQEISFRSAGSAFSRAGGSLRNASRKTALNVLEKASFDAL